MANSTPTLDGPSSPRLGAWDTASLIVGIVVGTAIFRAPQLVFENTLGPWTALGVWLAGGVLCLVGALCYAELATTYPRNGGDYEYLSRAGGRWLGFLFGWAQLAVILPGSIGAMAYAFADYTARLFDLPPGGTSLAWIAAVAVAGLSALNLLGLAVGKSLQNVLTAAKILGLAGVIAAGLAWGSAETLAAPAAPLGPKAPTPSLALALVFVLYAYGGWNDAVFVAAEVRDPRRNLTRALLLGVGGITLLYLATNAAYLAVLGFDAARETSTPAAAVLQQAVGPWAGKAVSLLVMVSALGAINGMILAGSRVYATVGEDHRLFAWLGLWNARSAVPVVALAVQAAIALGLIVAVGTPAGRAALDAGLTGLGLAALPWERFSGGFDMLVAGTAPVFWAFFLLTGLSVFVLRAIDPGRVRPFRVPLFPLPPILFCATCLYMLHASARFAGALTLLGVVPLALGVPLWAISRRMDGGREETRPAHMR